MDRFPLYKANRAKLDYKIKKGERKSLRASSQQNLFKNKSVSFIKTFRKPLLTPNLFAAMIIIILIQLKSNKLKRVEGSQLRKVLPIATKGREIINLDREQ